MARLALLLMLLPAAAYAHRRTPPLQPSCDAELQVVMCGDIPVTEVRDRAACCRTYRTQPTLPAQHHQISAAGLEESVFFTSIPRPDLGLQTGVSAQPIDWRYGSCTTPAVVQLPVFPGPRSAPVLQEQVVPQLTPARIRAVKQQALEQLPLPVRAAYERIRQLNITSGFEHPATCIGAAELALLQQRLADGSQPQTAAKMSLLTGFGVAPKMYPGLWHPPTDTPVDYPGPFAIPEVDVKYNGLNGETATCPDNYPSGAPRAICAHISFVELDAQMTFKSAIAYLATGDDRYAANVFRIIEGWADTNKAWGRSTQNGPLEAGWGCAAMAKALELLRNEAPAGLIDKFVSWMDTVITPQIDNFLDVITVKTVERGEPAFNNWHSTIGECEMSMALLTDNRTRFDRAVDVFHKTVTDYLTWGWGHGQFNQTRFRGECTETMRDIYHTEFGLAGLLQMAEMAWQQDEDLFSSNGHVLAAAMELHARIIRAAPLNNASDPDMLPAGFAPFDTMPKPPAGCIWKFFTQTQLWAAINVTSGAVVAQLQDGVKYVVGNVFLPSGWEVGYNHFAGRLGMKLPETAALLAKYWPEKYDFHWGLGTLSHAGTAAPLWRAGIDESALCGEAPDSPAMPSQPGDEPAVPSKPGDKPAVPSRPGDKPAAPTKPGDAPAVPAKPVAPMKPGGEPAVPSRPGGEPAVPSEPAVSPAAPQEPAQSSAEPATDEPATSADPAADETASPPEQPAEPADRSLEEEPAVPAAEPAEPASPAAEPAEPASPAAEPAEPASPAAEPAEPVSPPELMLPWAEDASVQPADLAPALPAAGR